MLQGLLGFTSLRDAIRVRSTQPTNVFNQTVLPLQPINLLQIFL